MRTYLSLLVAASLVFASSAALADGAPPPPEAQPQAPHSTHWYGYETLATDGAAIALLIPATALGDSGKDPVGFLLGSSLVYGLGGPIVHFAHGAVGKGFLDLGLRLGVPVVTGLTGGAIAAATYNGCSPEPDCEAWGARKIGTVMVGLVLGGLAGAGGAMAVDAAWLAREPRAPSATRVEPSVNVTPEGQSGARATVGLVGAF
jgi:hypothetical protein